MLPECNIVNNWNIGPLHRVRENIASKLTSGPKLIPAQAAVLMTTMPQPINAQVSRFCWQNLQADPNPDFPDPELLCDEPVQEEIYDRVFSDAAPTRPPRRYQVRILKQLIARIESAIEDWDKHVSSEDCVCLRGAFRPPSATAGS